MSEEQRIQELASILIDADGRLTPIDKIELEPLGKKVRWSIWVKGQRIQTVMAAAGELVDVLKATQIFLAVAIDQTDALHGDATRCEENSHG